MGRRRAAGRTRPDASAVAAARIVGPTEMVKKGEDGGPGPRLGVAAGAQLAVHVAAVLLPPLPLRGRVRRRAAPGAFVLR